MRNLPDWTLFVTCSLVLVALAGPHPTLTEVAQTAVGLAERALLAAGTVWLAVTVLKPRARTPEVTR